MGQANLGLEFDMYNLIGAMRCADVPATHAWTLAGVRNWIDGEVPQLKRRLALAEAIEASDPRRPATVKIDERMISIMAPGMAQAAGLKDARKLMATRGTLDPKLIASIAAHCNDPYFAAGFANGVSVDDLANVVRTDSGLRQAMHSHSPGLASWQQGYSALLGALGTTIATATRNTGTIALADDYPQRWIKTITADSDTDGRPTPAGHGVAASAVLRSGIFAGIPGYGGQRGL